LDNLIYGHEYAVRWGPLEQGDIGDAATLDRILSHYQPVAVMHFAAYAYVGESVTDPAKYYHNNVVGALSLLDAMRRNGVNQLVFSSTCATYGEPMKTPISEEHPQAPINPYGRTKWMIEQAMADYAQGHGLKGVALRYFNAAGADPDGEAGEDHDPETHLIPLVLQAAAGQRPAIAVFGDDYPTPDGTCVRDYIHVTDLADAHVRALAFLQGQPGFHAFNLGNGNGFSVKQVIETAERIVGHEIPTRIEGRRAGDPAILVGDATAAREQLGWQPAYDSLQTILQTAWRWEQIKQQRSALANNG
jgi:UDP-arabinose 4-epimerase